MFHNKSSTPTPAQYEAIGRVAAEWSILEFCIEEILARLAFAPDFPALALTNDLSADNRIKAIRNLVDMHKRRYHPAIIPIDVLDGILKTAKDMTKLKATRNRVIHNVWFRMSDNKMFGARFAGKQAPPLGEGDGAYLNMTLDDFAKFTERVRGLVNECLDLHRKLPSYPEPYETPSKSP